MRVNEDYETWNAAAQVADGRSVHAFWKQALAIRKQYDVLVCALSFDVLPDVVLLLTSFSLDLWRLQRHI